LKAITDTWKAIAELNGYIKAVQSDFSTAELNLLYIGEARSAMEIDGFNLAAIRVFEANASENKLNDSTAQLIFEMANIGQNLKQVNANALSLNFPFVQKRKRKKVQLPALKKEINGYLEFNGAPDPLLYMALLHGYIALQKDELNYQVFLANTIFNHWMKEQGLLEWPILPMSFAIKNNIKRADELLYDAFETDDLQGWVLFFLGMVQTAAITVQKQLIELTNLKKVTREMVLKYTLYHLPANALMSLLFEKPFIKAADLMLAMNCHRQTAATYLKHLESMGLLIEKKSGREKLYFHKRLFDVLIAS